MINNVFRSGLVDKATLFSQEDQQFCALFRLTDQMQIFVRITARRAISMETIKQKPITPAVVLETEKAVLLKMAMTKVKVFL